MKRQAMIVTIEQLRTLADDLEEEIKDNLENMEYQDMEQNFKLI